MSSGEVLIQENAVPEAEREEFLWFQMPSRGQMRTWLRRLWDLAPWESVGTWVPCRSGARSQRVGRRWGKSTEDFSRGQTGKRRGLWNRSGVEDGGAGWGPPHLLMLGRGELRRKARLF